MTPMRILGEAVRVPPISHVLAWGESYRGLRPLIDASQGTSGARPPYAGVTLSDRSEQYGDRWGAVGLRSALANDVASEYRSSEIGPADVLIAAGCNEAFCAMVRALVAPGERVILLSPFYFNHDMWLRLNGIEPLYLSLSSDGDVDPQALAACVTEASAICAVSPANPTGVELSAESIARIVGHCREHGIPFILDETYAIFRRDASRSPHDLFRLPDWRDFFVSLRSLSKEFSMPGHRVGAAIADSRLLDAAGKWHDCMAIVAPSAGQVFAEHALGSLTGWRSELAEDIRNKGDRFVERLSGEETGFGVDSWGGFFAWLKHPFPRLSDEAAAKRIACEVGVLTVPGSYFAPTETGRIRLSYAAISGDVLDDIVQRLTEISE